MGVFNFIETFFFISLGITFVLILLLVYHFKQRLNSIEQKNGTMFDIINNIVQEITTMKKIFLQQPRPNTPMYTRPVHLDSISEFVPSAFVPSAFVPSEFVPNALPSIIQLNDESDSESDSETDSESDSESVAESVDSDNSSVVSNTKIIVSDDDSIESNDNLHKDNHNIKIINLGTQLFDNKIMTSVVELSSPLPIETNSVLVELDPLDIVFDLVESVDTHIESVDTHIDTVDTHIDTVDSHVDTVDSQVADSQVDEDDVDDSPVKTIDISTHKSPKEREMAVYNNMSLSELKAKVIEKGLNTEPSKMKRPKLLSMLEKSID
jgi:hypothetical protein